MKKAYFVLFLIMFSATFFSCDVIKEEMGLTKPEEIEIRFTNVEETVPKEALVIFRLEIKNNDKLDREPVSYSVEPEGMAEIVERDNYRIIVRAKENGECNIRAQYKGKETKARLVIREPGKGGGNEEEVKVKLTAPRKEIEVEIGKAESVYVNIDVENEKFGIKWEVIGNKGEEDCIRIIQQAIYIAVVEGISTGSQKIRASHPKADNDVIINIIVKEN